MAQPKFEPERLEKAPLRYAPTNELGVVFLFSHVCRRMQLHIESIQAGFPDCIARQRVGGRERLIRIEFEFRSSNFRAHGHPADGCDWIVCWEHDWANPPANLKVLELRSYFGHGFNVWMISQPPQEDWPSKGEFAFGKRVAKGDLVLVYEYSPKQWFQQIYTVTDEGERKKLKSYNGIVYMHTIRRICVLPRPVHIRVFEGDRMIAWDSVAWQKFNRKMTDHWWRIHELIVQRNPECAAVLDRFSPSKV